jgi:hypothetical protein
MTTTSSDRRRYGVIETQFHTHGQVEIYVLSIGGQTWAQVEWSPSRRAWCIQDASGRCLAHCDAIHGQDVDAQTAVRLAKRMILEGRVPTPEQAEALLRERLAAEDAAFGSDPVRVDSIAKQLEEIEHRRLHEDRIEAEDHRIELYKQDGGKR